jgi:hypothetical protein
MAQHNLMRVLVPLAVLSALIDRPPKLVMTLDISVWGIPWRSFGADIEAWLQQAYAPVKPRSALEPLKGATLWARRDFLPELLRRCGDCAPSEE